MVIQWATWNLQAWNERLLAHFFRKRDENDPPVVVLLVTADELARATGDSRADAEAVRDSFVSCVRESIRRYGSLLEAASDYSGWPHAPREDTLPRFVGHLLFSCIAASESSEELGDEGKFVARLRDLSQDQLPDNSLQMLPRLWENLAAWLELNSGRYRRLNLPDPGGHTRIGYSVKLAFPDRRDQQKLSEILDAAGLAGHEPPVGRVVSLVANSRTRFRRSFLVAFDEFRRLFEASVGGVSPSLAGHRFWAAVRDASLRGRGLDDISDACGALQLLCEEQDDQLSAFLVAEEESGGKTPFAFVKLPFSLGPWCFGLAVDRAVDDADGPAYGLAVQAVLSGQVRLPRISSLIEQGVLLFAEAAHGNLELASHDGVPSASTALVRADLVADVVSLFGTSQTRPRSSAYAGWSELRNLVLRHVPSDELEATSLRRCWLLHESLAPSSIRLVGGVRADDGWLGFREVLPRIVAAAATGVVLEGEAGREVLKQNSSGEWMLPLRDLTGEFSIVASLGEERPERQAIRFNATPASERYKRAKDEDAWIVEGLGGTSTLSTRSPHQEQAVDRDYGPLAERAALLGVAIGEFVEDAQHAAWRISRFAGRTYASRCNQVLAAQVPTWRADDAHARSRWRKLLLKSTAALSDPGFEAARKAIRPSTSNTTLPTARSAGTVPDLESKVLARPDARVDRLVRVVAGRATARAGVDWRDWSVLVQDVLGVDKSQVTAITRAWMESGLVDVASSARWWHRSVFARSPCLVAFRVGAAIGATLSGLVLATTRSALFNGAQLHGGLVEGLYSASTFVPETLTFRFDNGDQLRAFSESFRIAIAWLEASLDSAASICRHDGLSDYPSNYENVWRWPNWSRLNGSFPDVVVQHHIRRDRPDFWVAESNQSRVWSYDLNVIRSWAAAMIGEPAVRAAGTLGIEANHAHLPLPLARALTALGGALPGPTDAPLGSYRYVLASQDLRDQALQVVARIFDSTRLTAVRP